MRIDKVVICCYKYDYWMAQICIASIRYWYPNVPLFLLKDHFKGNFNTQESQKYWQVQELSLSRSKFGWADSCMEILFESGVGRVLILDCDTIFAGPVLGELQKHPEDVVVSVEKITNPFSPWFIKTYYDFSKLKKIDPSLSTPEYAFNAGTILCNSGIINREDLNHLVNWSPPIKVKDSSIFPLAGQSILSYWIPKLENQGEISVAKLDYQAWASPIDPRMEGITLEKIKKRTSPPLIVHWAGQRSRFVKDYPYAELLLFFRNNYFDRLKFGALKKRRSILLFIWNKLKRRILNQ